MSSKAENEKAVFDAAGRGRTNVIITQVEMGTDINAYKNSNGMNAVMGAACGGKLETLKFLVEKGGDMRLLSNEGMNAVMGAACNGKLDTLKFLVEKGGDVHLVSKGGYNAVMCAAVNGDLNTMKFLVEKGGDMHLVSKEGSNAVMGAAINGKLECLKFLVEKGGDVHLKDKKGRTALIWAKTRGHSACVDFLRDFIERQAKMEMTAINEKAVFDAAGSGHTEIIRSQAVTGTNMNGYKDDNGWNAVMSASSHGKLDALKLLVEEGGDLHIIDRDGWNAVMSAANKGHLETLKFLVEKGGNMHLIDRYGENAVMSAAAKGHLNTLKFLVEKGGDVHLVSKGGYNAVMCAANYGNLGTLKFLVERGGDLHHKDKDGRTAIDLAKVRGKTACYEFLRDFEQRKAVEEARAKAKADEERKEKMEADRLIEAARVAAEIREFERRKSSVYVWLRDIASDKSPDEVWDIAEKFFEQECRSVEDVIAAKDIFDLKYLKNDLGIAPGIGGRIVKSLNDMVKPPPPPSPSASPLKYSNYTSPLSSPLKASTSFSGYSISGFEIIMDDKVCPVVGIKFGYFVDISGEMTKVVLKLADTGNKDTCRDIEREARILVNLKPLGSVVKILGVNPLEHLPDYIVMKHSGTSLSEFMINGNYETRKLLIPKILQAMLSIHSAGYVHNDVKPSNILINLNAENGMFSVIYCDFDQSYKYGEQIIASIFTAVFPDDPDEPSVLLTDQDKLYSDLGVSGAGQVIIEAMLRLNPDERMTIQDALREFQNIGTTKMHRDKKHIEEKLAHAEKNK